MNTSELSSLSAVRFARTGEFVTREIAGESIVVPVRGQVGDLDAIYNFNEVGAFIWNLFDGQVSVSDIAQKVWEKFEVAMERSELDTLEFVSKLQNWGVIVPVGRSSP